MVSNLNPWGQTRHWEEACIKTRRNIGERKRRLSFFRIKKNDMVLDLGCGDGLNIKILRQKGVKRLVGIDISLELLEEAKRQNPGVKFYLASAEKLPFKKETFDVVLVDSVFHHFMNYQKSLREIKRVLLPRGRLCFIEPHRSPLRGLYDFVSILPISSFIPFLKERRISYLGEIKFMKHWLASEDRFYRKLEKLGFKERLKKNDILSIIGIYEKPKKTSSQDYFI